MEALAAMEMPRKQPNILLCLSDDQSWPHASGYGTAVIQTPHFDRVARQGVLFNQAYCAAPSCTPSRSAILTGQAIWRLGQGGQLFGTLEKHHATYTDLLAAAGYHVGYMAKGWAPGRDTAGGRTGNPAGKAYKTFQQFLDANPTGQPWCFWFGSRDPHRGYRAGSGKAAGMDPQQVDVPGIWPDTPEIRSDICDYYFEIQRFDRDVGGLLEILDRTGQADDTLVVIAGDNGMPFPRAKATLYDLGLRTPLAIRWPRRVPPGRKVDDFVSLTDLAPTFLAAAGLAVPKAITGRPLLPILRSTKSGRIEPGRDCVYGARERHAWCRIDGKGYPSRMIRTPSYLYIRNYEPDRWPAGFPQIVTNEGPYGDVDASPTKRYMLEHTATAGDKKRFELAFGKRPAEELHDCRKDPHQMTNLADDPACASVKQELASRLKAHLKATGDPRETSQTAPWDTWPYYGRHNWPVQPEPK